MTGELLVVEDDDSIRKLLVIALGRAGFDVDAAADGAEAIERLARKPYRLVVFDLMMPRMDGRTLVAHVLGMAAPRPRLLLMTAAYDYDLGDMKGKVDRVFCKPFDVVALVAAVTELIDQQHAAA